MSYFFPISFAPGSEVGAEMMPEGVRIVSSVSSTVEVKISAVIFPEGDKFIAQGLEYDICAFGKTVTDAQNRFLRAVVSNAVLCVEHGKKSLEDIPPAPKKYWDMFKKSDVQLEKLDVERMPLRTPHMPSPIIRPTMRLVERAAT